MLLNSHQPERPRFAEDETRLLYATMPDISRRIPAVCTYLSMLTQCRLYRYATSGEVPPVIGINDLYQYVFHDIKNVISKVQMGYVAVATTAYETRKLLNNAQVTKPTTCYVFNHPDELQYGLEWMICTWLRGFYNSRPGDRLSGPEDMLLALQKLAEMNEGEYLQFEEDLFNYNSQQELDWRTLCEGRSENLPPPKARDLGPRPAAPGSLATK